MKSIVGSINGGRIPEMKGICRSDPHRQKKAPTPGEVAAHGKKVLPGGSGWQAQGHGTA
jgi:hypothetical protein